MSGCLDKHRAYVCLDIMPSLDPHARDRALYCLRCGTPWRPGVYACSALLDGGEICGCPEFAPFVQGNIDLPTAEGPLRGLLGELTKLPAGDLALMYGEPGAGKTTVALDVFDRYIWARARTEMSAPQLMRYAKRVGASPPLYVSDIEIDELEGTVHFHAEATADGTYPDLVVDSASATDSPRSVALAAKQYALQYNARALVLMHVTKEGEMRGENRIRHDSDCNFRLTHLRLTLEKGRHGPTRSLAVERDGRGNVVRSKLEKMYSVEGLGSSMHLARYPTRRARFADVFRRAKDEKLKLPPPPFGTAAAFAPLYDKPWIDPEDVDKRIELCHAHGIPYWSPALGLVEVSSDGDSDTP